MKTVTDWYSGCWVQTFTGRQVFPSEMEFHDVCIEDIAHSLSMQCRFNGHTDRFYSVAQHSVIVSNNVPRQDALWGLLHDAAEAYISDVVRPIKRRPIIADVWQRIEAEVQGAVCRRYGLSMFKPPSVRLADFRALVTEKRDVLKNAFESEDPGVEPFKETIVPWDPERAESEFLFLFEELAK
jgi:uncharacterized protein